MKKSVTAGAIVFVAGFIVALLLMGYFGSSGAAEEEVLLPTSELIAKTNVPDGAPAPQISVSALVDSVDGFNLSLETKNFTMTPGLVGDTSTPNTGYVTVYINKKKVSRLYGDWYHVDLDQLSYGQNTVEVVLTANDHTQWAVANEVISDAVIVEKVR